MNPTTLKAAIREAERFLEVARTTYAAVPAAERKGNRFGMPCNSSGKFNAATKRASMDLSRALSEMRRSG